LRSSQAGTPRVQKLRAEYWEKVKDIEPDNLVFIEPMIEAVGAKVICLSPYSPDFNPIELWWSQLKSFLRSFAPTSTEMVDTVISVALNLMNPQHLKNWFTNCCYCTS
jgi:transposase